MPSIINPGLMAVKPAFDGVRRSIYPEGGSPSLYAIGVPHPSYYYGYDPITEVIPSDPTEWATDEEHPLFYYINNETGNDANGNGTPTSPRLTIPQDMDHPAGTVIVVEATATTYVTGGDGRWQMYMKGNRTKKCWIVGRNGLPKLDDEFRMISCYHTIVDGFEWTKTGNAHYQVHDSAYSEYLTLRNCKSVSGTGAALSGALHACAGSSNLLKSKGLVIWNCEMSNYGENLATSIENDIHAFKPHQNYTDIWMLDCVSTNLGGDCVQVGGANTPVANRCERVYIAKNDFSNTLENAVDIKSARDIVISQNEMYNFNRAGTSGGLDVATPVIIHDDPVNVWCLANTAHNIANGLMCTGGDGVHFLGNVLYDIDPVMAYDPDNAYGIGHAFNMRATTNGTIAYNTVYDYSGGFAGAGAQDIDIRANIFHTRNRVDGHEFNFANINDYAGGTSDNNVFYPVINAASFRRYTTEETLAQYQVSTSQEANAITVDPLLNAPLTQDFRLQTGSPAIDAGGTKPDAIADFLTLYGIGIDVDYQNDPRGTVGNIGAIEEVV